MYATRVKGILLLAVLGACDYPRGALPADGEPDVPPPDVTPTWAIDSQSKKGVPSSTLEWTELIQANGLTVAVPDDLWLMQDTSGSLEDSIGTNTLTPLASPSYGNTVNGWSRRAVGTFDTVANQGFYNQTTGNLNGTSYLLLAYVSVLATPSGERSLLGIGAAGDHRYVAITSSSLYKGAGSGVAPTNGTVSDGDIHRFGP